MAIYKKNLQELQGKEGDCAGNRLSDHHIQWSQKRQYVLQLRHLVHLSGVDGLESVRLQIAWNSARRIYICTIFKTAHQQ